MSAKVYIEKRHDLITRAEKIIADAKAEVRELTEAEAAELAEIRDNVRKIVEFLQMDDDFRELAAATAPAAVKEEPKGEENETRAQVEAFEAFIRGKSFTRANLDMTTGGALIPTVIMDRIIRKMYEICPILDMASKYSARGNLDIPYYDEDSTNLIQVAYRNEFEELTANVGTFSSIQLTGYLAGGLVPVSRSLLNSQNFDLTGYVVDQMAYSFKRWIEGELLNGTSGKIQGLSGVTQQLETAAATAITADEVIQLHDKILDEFQPQAVWIMSRNTRTALRTLKDDMGRYLLQDDISLPFGTSILGKPVYVSDNMPEIGAGNNAIYYGDMSGLAVKWVEEMSIEVLREKFATQHAIGVVGWTELDSKVENQQKLAVLKCKAA